MSDYHAIKALSNSSLSVLKRSPTEFYKRFVTEDPKERMTAEDDVHCAFAWAGCGVEICCNAACRLIHYEGATVLRLAEHFGAGRQIQQHCGAGQRQCAARWIYCPQVLA